MKSLFNLRALVLIGVAAALFAQEPTFRANANLVVVNVSVRDKSGKLLENLKKDDFELLEDGKPQSISVFEVERLNNTALPTLPVDNAPTKAPPRAQSAPYFSGDVARKDRRMLALFFDLSSMQPPEQMRAQTAALKFLQQQMTASDLVAILTFTNRLRVLEDFTDDRERLLTAIRSMRLGDSSELADQGTTGADATDDSGTFVADETEFNIFNTDQKLGALEDAARKLGVFPEKKALIYFSSGISKTGVENQAQLLATVNTAVRANVSFYPVDARGLVATPAVGDASTPSPHSTGAFTGAAHTASRDSYNDQQDTLSTLATDTGGKAMLDSNDLTLGIRRAEQDLGTYYILGYYSTNGALDGRFRKVRVRLKPEIAAKLDYRPGYYAGKQFKNFTASDKERQLEEALALGNPVTELPLALEVDYFRIAHGQYFVPIAVKIPGSAIELSKRDKTDFDFIGQIRDGTGKLIGGVRDGITINLKGDAAAQLAHRQLAYDTGVTLAPGDYKVTFLARENQTGKMGTFETKFTIPDLDKLAPDVRMSSIVLSNQREPLSATVGSAGTSKKLMAMHPLIQNGTKLVPSVTRVFRSGQKMYVYFEVYDAALNPAKAASVAAELDLFRGKSKEFSSEPLRQTTSRRPNTLAFQFELPLTKLTAGQYTAQINVIDEQARKFAISRSNMVLLP